MPMRRRAALALATACSAVALAGCGGGGGGDDDAAEEARRQAEQLEQKSVEAATVDALFGALCGLKGQCAEINEKLQADPTAATADAKAVCEFVDRKDEAGARAEVGKRFTAGSFKPSEKIQDDVVHILTIRICPIV